MRRRNYVIARAPKAPAAISMEIASSAAFGGLLAMTGTLLLFSFPAFAQEIQPTPQPKLELSDESAKCVECHAQTTPVIVRQWRDSKHAGTLVGCFECHEAEKEDVDAFQHEGQTIRTIVTPKTCTKCHSDEEEEFSASHHSKAAQFTGSLDNVLGMFAEGPLAAANGCWQCHGSTISFLKNEKGEIVRDEKGKPKFDPLTWPNTGIGRVNLDGSMGTCTACHSRHAFSKAMARQPETCGKCHMGPDHPQIEIFNESKHGIAFRTQMDKMNLESDSWVLGKDYSAAPTCATCHMSATPTQKVTHDVGARISWTLRPPVSKKLENWETRRDAMKDTCFQCHSPDFVNAFYKQYDDTVTLYNEKFGKPATQIMEKLKERKLISADPFNEEIEWTYYFLWHHEGRRARMGVSMQGPDYTQWHGFFEVAHRFYFELIPQARELAEKDPEAKAFIEEIMARPEHSWIKGIPAEEKEKIYKFYMERYGQKAQ